MIVFTALDWFWLVAFLLVMILTGVLFYRLGKRSQSDFFLAGRGLPWWLPATSVYATHTATDTPMWVSGVIYRYGMAGIWYTFFAAWCAISAFASTRIFRRSLAYSQAEWQTLRFSGLGSELLRGWMAGWQIFMNMFILGWVGIAMGKLCKYVFGWDLWVGLVVFSSICAVYVLAAGYWGVVIADFQQGVIAFLGILIASAWGVYAAGGPSGIVRRLAAMNQLHRLNPFSFTGFFQGDFPAAWFLTMLVIALLGGFGMGTSIDWYVEAQRIQSARTVRDAAYSIWAGTALVLTRNSLWAASILAFFVLYPDIAETRVYEMAWYRIGFEMLPPGLVGFFFAAIVAIHLSTVASILNLGALYATRDLYQHYINPKASERRIVWVGRISTLLVLLGSFLYGSMMEEITQWIIFAVWTMAAGIWLPNILQVLWWRFNSWGYLSSWIANLGMSWLVVWILPHYGILPRLPDYQQFWLLMGLGLIVYIPVTFLTPPDDLDHLIRYYVQSRPMGLWGPVRKEAEKRGLIRQVIVKVEGNVGC
ncbi:MAG: sodium:solute symporter [Acidobacteria bacterium]|nr:MAG: sodium:solute symporter [Acidobacteriota bacterium]